MKGQNKMKKQSAKTTSATTIRATIEFSNIYEVLHLENALTAIVKNEPLTEDERKELQRVVDLVESLTGDRFVSHFLEKCN